MQEKRDLNIFHLCAKFNVFYSRFTLG